MQGEQREGIPSALPRAVCLGQVVGRLGRQGETSQAVCADARAMGSHWRMWREGCFEGTPRQSCKGGAATARDFPTQARAPCFPSSAAAL